MPLRKISAGQLMLLLFLSRIMHTMIFRAESFASGTPLMLGLLVSTAVEALLAIPLVIYFSKGGADPASELFPSRPRLLKIFYSIYFLVIAGTTVALFTGFLQSEFSNVVSPIFSVLLIFAASAYCASNGVEGLGRAGTVVFWLFAGLFVFMASVNEGGFDLLNIRPMTENDLPPFFEYLADGISSAWWLPMFCALGENLRSGAAKAAYGYLVLKLAVLEALLFLVTIILWRYVDVLGYPIFALGAYAKTDFIQRFDAINMLVWAINCVIVVGTYVFICAKSSKKPKAGSYAAAALGAGIAFLSYKSGLRFNDGVFLIFKAAGVILLGTAVPAAALIKLGLKRRAEK